ncbi:AAA family ATPase [Candidatus Riflebacteria bacterium]
MESNKTEKEDELLKNVVSSSRKQETASLLDPDEVEKYRECLHSIHNRLDEIILGQSTLNKTVLLGVAADGHLLLEGLPGLGKTELVKSLASLLGLAFKRIQFTPDLMPGDITGTQILQENTEGRRFVFHRGPIFTQILLADEINRASPKTQSALLEAMQEKRVTILGETYRLSQPFFVLATQNPIELEGTYPLPEAQVDRFLMKVEVKKVNTRTLSAILYQRGCEDNLKIETMQDCLSLLQIQKTCEKIFLPEAVANYISNMVAASHPDNPGSCELVKKFVRFGASPRAALALLKVARAAALYKGKPNLGFAEVDEFVYQVLNHRIILDYSAQLEKIKIRDIIEEIIQQQKKGLDNLPASLKIQA